MYECVDGFWYSIDIAFIWFWVRRSGHGRSWLLILEQKRERHGGDSASILVLCRSRHGSILNRRSGHVGVMLYFWKRRSRDMPAASEAFDFPVEWGRFSNGGGDRHDSVGSRFEQSRKSRDMCWLGESF